MTPVLRTLTLLSCLALASLLSGCDMVVLDPSGDVAARQRDLLVISTLLMLLIIVPVMALTVWFAWRYRHNNREARYEPDWHHSMRLELVIWSAPLLIIICLGAITWLGTHLLDPYRKLDRLDKQRPLTAETRELVVQVVAMDWKWLFVYPQHGVATVNELVLPVDRPVSMRVTASSVMNSLYIPEFAGMIYAMPGMQTQLHGVMNEPGSSEGFSANYSGHGFSGMKFTVRSVEAGEFDRWVDSARAAQDSLTRERYLELAKPSQREPVRHFARVDARLFDYVLGDCVQPGRLCSHDMAEIDRRGGLGKASIYNVARTPEGDYLMGVCKLPDATPLDDLLKPSNRSPLLGAGLPLPRTMSESGRDTPLLAVQP
jgi:cytochrome o ubiquinol oxidase subunit 2